MHRKRVAFFVIMIMLGLVLGLIYGWIINPVRSAEISPGSLRADYRADYVLMVAEIYHADGNLEQAVARLKFLGAQQPAIIAADGLSTARSLGYTPADLSLIENLTRALQNTAATSPVKSLP